MTKTNHEHDRTTRKAGEVSVMGDTFVPVNETSQPNAAAYRLVNVL